MIFLRTSLARGLFISACLFSQFAQSEWQLTLAQQFENKAQPVMIEEQSLLYRAKQWRSELQHSREVEDSSGQESGREAERELDWHVRLDLPNGNRFSRSSWYLQQKLTRSLNEQSSDAELQLVFGLPLALGYKLTLASDLQYLDDNQLGWFKHEMKAGLKIRSHLQVKISAERNMQQSDHYRLDEAEWAFVPESRLATDLKMKAEFALVRNFRVGDWYPMIGIELKYNL